MKLALRYITYFLLFWGFANCTIQKRTVNKGYFVQWHLKKNNTSSISEQTAQKYTNIKLGDDNHLHDTTVIVDNVSNDYFQKELVVAINPKVEFINKFSKKKSETIKKATLIFLEEKKTTNKLNKYTYFNKEKGKKALKYIAISAAAFLFLIAIIFMLIANNEPDLGKFSDIFYVSLMFLNLLVFLVFGILAIILFISAFFKPKEKKPTS